MTQNEATQPYDVSLPKSVPIANNQVAALNCNYLEGTSRATSNNSTLLLVAVALWLGGGTSGEAIEAEAAEMEGGRLCTH